MAGGERIERILVGYLGVKLADSSADDRRKIVFGDLAAVLVAAERELVGQQRMHAVDSSELLRHCIRRGMMVGRGSRDSGEDLYVAEAAVCGGMFLDVQGTEVCAEYNWTLLT